MRRCRIESLGASLPKRHLFRWGSVRQAVEAGRRCLRQSHYRPADVSLLINAGVHRDGHVCEPAGAAYIQHRLGINIEFQGRDTLSFDLTNGGCGMLNAAQVTAALMESGDVRVGMVVAGEANSDRRPDPSYAYPASGAALLLDISPVPGTGFGTFSFHTREDWSDLYVSTVSRAGKRGRILLRRRLAELEEAWLTLAGPAAAEVLEREGLRPGDLDLVVPAQVSAGFLGRLPDVLGLPREKVADFSGRLPDTLSTSTFLALHLALAGRPPAPGSRVLLLAFGSGVTVGAALYRI
jgi:3-oxoacyl-[acyl-carrier-protein] synthase III